MGFLISHDNLDNCCIKNNNMYNFWEFIGKPLESKGYILEGFSINAPITNAANAFKNANIIYNKAANTVIDLSNCTNAVKCFNNTSYGTMSYIDKIILNSTKISTRTNDFMRNANIHVNELCILGSAFNANSYIFDGAGVTVDHIYLQTGSANISINRCNGWRYCIHEDGNETFSIRSLTQDETTRKAGFDLIGPKSHPNGLIMHWGSTNTPFFSGYKLFSLYNTNRVCTSDPGNFLYYYDASDPGTSVNWGPNGILPAVGFDNYTEWNDPNGINIRSNINNTKSDMRSMVNWCTPYSGTSLVYRWLKYGDFAPICGKYTTTMNNAFHNCDGIRSLSPVCGENVVYMYNTYRNCYNMPGNAACGPNVKFLVNTYENCANITKAACGPNVERMNRAYYGCKSLKESACGDSVLYMDQAYQGCTTLKTAVVGPAVVSMNNAFADCTSLTTATDAAHGISDISNAYARCPSLTKFVSHCVEYKDEWWSLYGEKCGISRDLWDTMEYIYEPYASQ